MTFGERLQVLIEKLGWNQSRLAREVGSSSVQIGRWLQNKVSPTANSLRRIADATSCELEWLTTGEGPMFQEVSPYYNYMTKEELESYQRGIDELEFEMQKNEDEDLDIGEEMELDREKEVAQLLAKASAVLKFKFKHNTQYHSDSLAATITALYRAIKLEEKFIPKRGLMALKKSGRK